MAVRLNSLENQEILWDGLWCWDLKNPGNGSISSKLAQHLGYFTKSSEPMPTDFLSLVFKEDLKLIEAALQCHSAASGEHPMVLDIRLNHLEGYSKWFNLRGNMVSKESGEVQSIMGVAICIDKYKGAERQLRLKKNYYKNAVKGANIGIWEVNLKTGNIVCNARWAEMVGYDLKELEPLTNTVFLSLVHPMDVKVLEKALDDHVGGFGVYEVEFRMKHKRGHWVWILSQGEIIDYGPEGRPEIITGINYDISVRKTNEILLKKYKDLYERSSEAAKIGYWELDQVEEVLFWSKVVKQIHEVAEDYVPTVANGLDFYLEGENRERIKIIFAQSVQKPTEFDEHFQIRTIGGNLKWIRLIVVSEFIGNKCTKIYGLIQDIDQIKKSQLEIKFREEQFRQTFNHSSVGMALINAKNILIKANKSFCHIFGYSESEMQRMDLGLIAYPEDLKSNRSLIEDLFHGKCKHLKLEHRFLHKDGSIIWTNISMSAIHNDKGEIIHFVSQVQDITERKNNELLLAHNTDIMNRINEVAHIGIWELDFIANIVHWSPTIKKMVKVPENYVPTLEEVYPFFLEGEHRETLIAAIETAIEKGEGFDLELQVVATDQTVFWSRTIGIAEMVDGVCTRLYGIFQDIDEKARATKKLAVKEEEFRRSFEHAAIGMIVVDLEGKLTKVNPRVCEIIGYDEKEILDKSIFDFVHPEDMEMTKKLLEKTISTKSGFKMEKRCRHRSGNYIWVYEAVAAVKNDKGELMHFACQIQDISDKKLLTENLTEHNNRLINFAHIVSHNLRSHTSNISMLLDLALQQDPNIINNDYYRNIKVVSDNMNETIYQLNEIVEINSKVSSTLTSQNLSENVQRALTTVDSLVRKNNAKLELELNGEINVLAVPAYLESIILNLITNAIKYKSPDRPVVLKIKSGMEGDFAFLSIADNGLGIDLDRHGSKLFGMYKTFHSHPEARGIGLFISKNQIEAMGGHIEVESEMGKGTTFTTYFKII
tara:strand:- start:948 stop:3929 length:2982 start_codon:yes stop_codon:yes gene_type:complete